MQIGPYRGGICRTFQGLYGWLFWWDLATFGFRKPDNRVNTMKRFLSVLSLLTVLATGAFAQVNLVTDEEVDPDAPVFAWAEEVHNWGDIPQGIPVTHKFTFTNEGKSPLIISNVQKTCGCTVTNWTKEPILPGESGFVEAQYNAARAGAFNKAITVQSNASTPNKKLYFKGTVAAGEKEEGVPEKKSIFTPNN